VNWVGKLYEDKFGRVIDNKPTLTEEKKGKAMDTVSAFKDISDEELPF
jgi:hypothetical protein